MNELRKDKLIAFALITAGALLPLKGLGSYWTSVLVRANFFAIFVISLDFFSGTTGYLNLGHTLLIGIGAYISAFLNHWYHIQPALSILAGALAAPLIGLLLFLPSLRVKGVYFAILSLLTPMVFEYLMASYPYSIYFGGEGGLRVDHFMLYYLKNKISPRAWAEARLLSNYYTSYILMLISVMLLYKVSTYTNLGFKMRAIGQDESLARASGVDTTRIRFVSFFISGFLAGLAGALYVHSNMLATLSLIDPGYTLIPILTMWVLGGIGNTISSAVGSYIVVILEEGIRPFTGEYRILVLMALLLALVIFRPRGVVNELFFAIKSRWNENER